MTEQSADIQRGEPWAKLLTIAVSEPGRMLEAYNAFHSYSLGNQLLAMLQCHDRDIAMGPLATYKAWQARGRQVKRGSKAIELCMPVTGKRETENKETGETEIVSYSRFIFRKNWFVLAQTEGEPYHVPELPEWNKARALSALDITESEFTLGDGNVQGYARDRSIAINPLAQIPIKTTFHELAHVVLGHTTTDKTSTGDDEFSHDAALPRNLREVEAESVALLCLSALGLDGVEFCRGYIQSWLQSNQIPEANARRIMKAADLILKAGRPETEKGERS